MAHGPEATPGGPGDFRPGGMRGVSGFFHLAQHATGQWWLIDPEGRPAFIRAVHGVRNETAHTDGGPAADAAVRLRNWGFNAVGIGGDEAGKQDGLPFFGGLNFVRTSSLVLAPGVRLPDVFEPNWPERAVEFAALGCAQEAANPALVAWITDDALAWGQFPAGGLPGLLQVCLSLEPSFAAYHAAWEFTLATHGGSLDAVARAWGVALPNKEVVREMTRTEVGVATRGYLRDDGRWTREFAHRYFFAVKRAIHAVDPRHLVCGCRFNAPVGVHVLGAARANVDVPLLHWSEIPAPGADHGPVLAGELSWGEETFWSAPSPRPGRRTLRLTAVERMLRRARTVLRRLARHPAVVGYVWRRWHDESGEQPPFAGGLIHRNGTEAREHAELLADFNTRAESLRHGATKRLSP